MPDGNKIKPVETVDEAILDFIILHEGFEPNKMGYDLVTGAPWIGSGIEVPKYIELFKNTGKWSAADNRKAVRELVIANRPLIRLTFGKAYDKLTPAQKGVIDDVAYNIGVGKLNMKHSPGFVKAVLSGNMEEAARQMDWGNHQAKGLRVRNAHRQKLWGVQLLLYNKNRLSPLDSRNYDYNRADELGYEPDETGHWPTRDVETGLYLKSATHPTVIKSIIKDNAEGYNLIYDKSSGKLGSRTWIKPFMPEPVEYEYPILLTTNNGYKNGKLPIYPRYIL